MTRRAAGLLVSVALVTSAGAMGVRNAFDWAAVDRMLGRGGAETVRGDVDSGQDQLYTCSMHPQVVQHEPGSCPLCRMDLVPLEAPAPRVDTGHDHDQDQLYTCSMHPQVVQHEPGSCPLCRMDLVPIEAPAPRQATADPAGDSGGYGNDPGVHVNPGFLQAFSVRTARVERGALQVDIRTVGILAHNERNIYSVNAKYSGWIERARVANVGEQVAAGELLFEIYSPDLVTTQHEYLGAMDFAARLEEQSADDGALERALALLDAARERLLHADMTTGQVEALEATRQVSRTVELVAPASGFIVEKMGDSLEGMRIEPGMTVLKIADHSSLWVEAEFYEQDVRHLRPGQRVTVTVDAFPERRWEGVIDFFRPAMNPGTRTLTAFVEVDNADLRLRPRMFASIQARAPGAADALLVPADAVLHSGEHAVVVVARGEGYFTPRRVRLGLASDGRQQVVDGLNGDEEIVVSSQFLIDSESNLEAAIAQLLGRADARPEGQESAP